MAVPTLNTLSLCTGYGGIEIGLQLAGIRTRLVAACERDPYAAAVLVARMEEAAMGSAPIWDCIESFPSEQFAGLVDLICAGFSCQPWSAAGKRLGTDDDRWLWPDIAKIIRTVGPSYVFLENVRGLMGGGIDLVLGDLADLGFDAQWDLFSASDIGAPHKRERLWILAYAMREGRPEVPRSSYGDEGTDGPQHSHLDNSGSEDVAYAMREGRPEIPRSSYGHEGTDGPQHGDLGNGDGEDVAYTDIERPRRQRVSIGGTIGRTETERRSDDVADTESLAGRGRSQLVGNGQPYGGNELERRRFPPRPDDIEGWAEWRASGGPEPSIRRGADGAGGSLDGLARADRLHLLGNGVVSQCAAFAFTTLARRAGLI